MKKFILATVLATLASNAVAFDIPKAQVNSTYDRVRTSTGAECQTSLDTGHYLNAGLYAKEEQFGTDVGIFVGLTFKLGMDKIKTQDCNPLLRMQEKRDTVEIERLQAELDLMRLQQQMLAKQADAATVETAGEDW